MPSYEDDMDTIIGCDLLVGVSEVNICHMKWNRDTKHCQITQTNLTKN